MNFPLRINGIPDFFCLWMLRVSQFLFYVALACSNA